MSKLIVEVDYVKIAQWMKTIKYFQEKIRDELDKAAKETNINLPDRRQGERRDTC